ncbi:MAG: hypothetical protein CM1200mP18_22610 [Gammaproteobacteria bacterium]|nr:MAG: hypothetical protein CM1200mP18_22610 [Gammaproteobacteria bacterium]
MNYPFKLGEYSRPITTCNPEVQIWFDRGLAWVYGFNHEEGAKCLRRAVDIDPTCAMAHWGMALASGPFYNLPWEWLSANQTETMLLTCYEAVQQAVKHSVTLLRSKKHSSWHCLSVIHPIRSLVRKNLKWDDAYAERCEPSIKNFRKTLTSLPYLPRQ